MKELDLKETSSKSLLADVLNALIKGLDDDFGENDIVNGYDDNIEVFYDDDIDNIVFRTR